MACAFAGLEGVRSKNLGEALHVGATRLSTISCPSPLLAVHAVKLHAMLQGMAVDAGAQLVGMAVIPAQLEADAPGSQILLATSQAMRAHVHACSAGTQRCLPKCCGSRISTAIHAGV